MISINIYSWSVVNTLFRYMYNKKLCRLVYFICNLSLSDVVVIIGATTFFFFTNVAEVVRF